MPQEPIKKRYSLDDDVKTHIFDGEISGNTFSGLHSEARKSIDAKDSKEPEIKLPYGWPPGQLQRRTDGKSYYAKVMVKIGGKWYGPGWSSFFPLPAKGNQWDEKNLVRMVEQALTAPTDVRADPNDFKEKPRALRKDPRDNKNALTKIRVGGLPCEVLYENKEIASIYPVVPGSVFT